MWCDVMSSFFSRISLMDIRSCWLTWKRVVYQFQFCLTIWRLNYTKSVSLISTTSGMATTITTISIITIVMAITMTTADFSRIFITTTTTATVFSITRLRHRSEAIRLDSGELSGGDVVKQAVAGLVPIWVKLGAPITDFDNSGSRFVLQGQFLRKRKIY